MSTAPVLTSRIDVEVPQWLVVPELADATPGWRAEVLRLFETIVEVDAAAEGDQRLFADGRQVDPPAAIESLLAFRAGLGPGQRLVAGLGVPNRWPLPVVVSVGLTDDDGPDLLELAGATGGLPVERPAVDELPEHVGGEGPIVTRHDLDDDGVVWATVCAVRRERIGGDAAVEVDTRVLWRTRELEVVPAFASDLVDLVGSIRNEVSA